MHVRDRRDDDSGGPSVFISYAHPDARFAEHLKEKLYSAGVDNTVLDRDLPAGESFSDVLNDAIDQVDVVVVLMSPDYFSSRWAQWELAKALSSKKRVIPILVRPGVVEGPLRYIQFLDATDNPLGTLDRCVEVVKAGRRER
jgi:hypothetical protein